MQTGWDPGQWCGYRVDGQREKDSETPGHPKREREGQALAASPQPRPAEKGRHRGLWVTGEGRKDGAVRSRRQPPSKVKPLTAAPRV